MSRRTGVLLIIVVLIVVLLGIGMLLVTGGLSLGAAPQEEAAEITPVPTTPPGVPIVIARTDAQGIRRGREIQEDDLDVVLWPQELLPPDPLAEPAEAIGRIARTDILPGQPVLNYMLFSRDDPTTGVTQTGSDAALIIPQNYVAIAFPITRLSSVAYALRSGDHVDLLMSFRFVDIDEEYQTVLPAEARNFWVLPLTGEVVYGEPGFLGYTEEGPLGTMLAIGPSEDQQRPRQVTQVVIFDAIVLRAGSFPLVEEEGVVVVVTPEPETQEEAGEEQAPPPTPVPLIPPDIVTLMMPRQDALVLKYAMETGADIDLVLRSVYDNGVDFRGTTEPVTLDYIVRNYNVPVPVRLEYSQQPRIDYIVQEGEIFVPRPPEEGVPGE